MQMDAGLDTGPVLLREVLPIREGDDAGALHDRLADMGAALGVQALDLLQQGVPTVVPQAPEGVTYAAKIRKEETVLDWNESAELLCRKVRAFSPAPGARARLRGVELKILSAKACPANGTPGRVLHADAKALVVGCRDGSLSISHLQRAGGRRLAVAQFLQGFPVSAKDSFEVP